MALAVRVLRAGGDAALERAVRAGDFRSSPRPTLAARAPVQASAVAATTGTNQPASATAAAAVAELRAGLLREAVLMNKLHQDLDRRMLLVAATPAASRRAAPAAASAAGAGEHLQARQVQPLRGRRALPAAAADVSRAAAAASLHVQGLKSVAGSHTPASPGRGSLPESTAALRSGRSGRRGRSSGVVTAAGARAEAVAERVGEGLGAGLCAVLGLAC